MALVNMYKSTQVFRIFQFSKSSIYNFLNDKNIKFVQSSLLFNNVYNKSFCTEVNSKFSGKLSKPNVADEKKKKKGLTSPQISLILPEESVMTLTLENAEKLAKRRDLKLVQVLDFDTKTEKPLYKLMTKHQIVEEEIKHKEKLKQEKNLAVKDLKVFLISTRIEEHDLHIKINHMTKTLKKKHQLKIYISLDGNPKRATEIVDVLNEELKEVAVMEKNIKAQNTIKLFFVPITESKTEKKPIDSDIKNTKEGKEKKEVLKK